jgi:large subunit ribosomal protein L3
VPIELLCRKVGNTQIFSEAGEAIPVTILEAGSNTVVQKKTLDKDGYSAVQLAFGERKASRTTKALAGHYKKAGVAPQRVLRESRLTAEEVAGYEVGQQIPVDVFAVGQKVDVIGTSKGRGFAGVIKRHHFKLKRASHGTHENFRHTGTVGPGTFPGHVLRGRRMSGHMGAERVTVRNVEVVRVDAKRGLLYVKGGVPGHPEALVQVRPTKKAGK